MDYKSAYESDSRIAQEIGLREHEYRSFNDLVFSIEEKFANSDRYYSPSDKDPWRTVRRNVRECLSELLFARATSHLAERCGLSLAELEQLHGYITQIESNRKKGLHSVDVLASYRNARSGPVYYHWQSPLPGTCKFISHCLATRWENREFTMSMLKWATVGILLVILLAWFSPSFPILWIPAGIIFILSGVMFWAAAGSAQEQESL